MIENNKNVVDQTSVTEEIFKMVGHLQQSFIKLSDMLVQGQYALQNQIKLRDEKIAELTRKLSEKENK